MPGGGGDKGSEWCSQEEALLLHALGLYGNNWVAVSTFVSRSMQQLWERQQASPGGAVPADDARADAAAVAAAAACAVVAQRDLVELAGGEGSLSETAAVAAADAAELAHIESAHIYAPHDAAATEQRLLMLRSELVASHRRQRVSAAAAAGGGGAAAAGGGGGGSGDAAAAAATETGAEVPAPAEAAQLLKPGRTLESGEYGTVTIMLRSMLQRAAEMGDADEDEDDGDADPGDGLGAVPAATRATWARLGVVLSREPLVRGVKATSDHVRRMHNHPSVPFRGVLDVMVKRMIAAKRRLGASLRLSVRDEAAAAAAAAAAAGGGGGEGAGEGAGVEEDDDGVPDRGPEALRACQESSAASAAATVAALAEAAGQPLLAVPEQPSLCPVPRPVPRREMDAPLRWYRRTLGSPRHAVAPMVDASELPFRMLCRAHGAHLAYTPMLHARNFSISPSYRAKHLTTCAEDRPLLAQFCSRDPRELLLSGLMAQDQCDAIDINFGCPQRIAARGGYGAFLMDELELAYELVRTLRAGLSVPVTVKIRRFPRVEDTVRYARALVAAGAHMVAVHGRTRDQKGGYRRHPADWAHIKAVVDAIGDQVPVMANGNIRHLGDVQAVIDATGVVGVLSAESLLEEPALFELKPEESMVAVEVDHSSIDSVDAPRKRALAREYLRWAEKYPVPVKWQLAHVCRMLPNTLAYDDDVRDIICGASDRASCEKALDTVDRWIAEKKEPRRNHAALRQERVIEAAGGETRIVTNPDGTRDVRVVQGTIANQGAGASGASDDVDSEQMDALFS